MKRFIIVIYHTAKGVITFMCHPVHNFVELLHKRKMILSTKKGRVYVGVCIMAIGSTIACIIHEIHMPTPITIFFDLAAYGIHGFGAAPIVKIIAESLEIEI